jgi:O-antigen/teichoic acid export membrane protein
VKNLDNIYTSKRIAKNTIYNLLGYGIPLIVALVLIPYLIKGLGEERFGILNLAWVVIGYFSFLDLGIGRALTKIVAEKIGSNQVQEIPSLFWTSFFLLFFVSLFCTVVVIFLAPTLVCKIFNISKDLQTEALNSFYVLALSIPIVTTTAGVRGVLEAYQKFGTINIIRILLGVFSFLIPLFCLFFSSSLFWIMIFLLILRILVWVLYVDQCFRLNINIQGKLFFDSRLIKPILKFGGWITVSNVVVPVIVYLDRFLIGALVSVAAITYYATPYEVVSKLLLVPGAITGVLFPAFSASYLKDPDFTKKLSMRAVKYIFIIMYPIVFLIISFAYDGLNWWLGQKFADNSSLILQLLAAGILFNSIAYIPFTFLQGIGKPDIAAKIQLIELPIYLIFMWIAIKHSGILGAALIWFLRMILDSAILFLFSEKLDSGKFKISFKLNYLLILALIAASVFPCFISEFSIKLALVLTILIIFSYLSWKILFLGEERTFFISRIRRFI